MPIRRQFLDPARPALPAAAEFLLDRYTAGRTVDLAGVVVVLPGARAGRRLLEILVEQAERHKRTLVPPEIKTVGTVPELLYELRPGWRFADEMTQKLAWADAIRRADREAIVRVMPQLPQEAGAARWIELGELLRRLHTELAADGLDFGDVVEKTAELGQPQESRRWQILRMIQEAYLSTLDELELWDVQTARLVAIRNAECRTDKDIVLVGTVDINRALQKMLTQVADRVTALVHAPAEWSERFDEFGCLRPEAWRDARVELSTEQIRIADDPADQADRVARCIAEYNGRFRADEITIGVADEPVVPQIQRQLGQADLPCRWGPGRPISETGPYRLLAALADYLDRGRYRDMAALVRHPDLYDWIARQGVAGHWLAELDRYYNERLPSRVRRDSLEKEGRWKHLADLCKKLDRLLRPLAGDPQPLHRWGPPILQVLRRVYGRLELDRDEPASRATIAACEAIRGVLVGYEQNIPEPLSPKVSAAEAIRLALAQAGSPSMTVPSPADTPAIELLGWLELPLDDAPAMIVTGVNEGFVPKSVNSDLFLPNTLRSRLGLQDNARRYARDAYALNMLAASRERLALIVGRRTVDGDPLAPSRLLFAADQETIARRALAFFRAPSASRARGPLPGAFAPKGERSGFVVPRPMPLARPAEDQRGESAGRPGVLKSIRVTAFRDYLACPYRFYLKHVLKLEAIDDAAEELDGAAFGTLVHEVLRRFGRSAQRDSTDPAQIRRVLRRELDRCAGEMFVGHPLPALRVQIEQMGLRLDALAERQAEWAAAGWRIEHVEAPSPDKKATLSVDGEPMILRGRIDRIDRNRETGQWAIFDYKSSDTARTPEQVHQSGGQWVDLQLPLYRHLARCLGVDGPVGLGYITLPKDIARVEFRPAEWTDDDLAEADEKAEEVIRGIRQGIFWPPADPPPDFSEEFAPICQDGVFDKPAFDDEPAFDDLSVCGDKPAFDDEPAFGESPVFDDRTASEKEARP